MKSLFRKFKEKSYSKESMNTNIHNEDENISTIYSNKINGQEFSIKIDTTTKFLEKFDNNLKDLNSCEREPNSNEIRISVDYPIYKLKGDINDINLLFNEQEIASLKGYKYFIVKKELFENLEKGIIKNNQK